MVGVVGYVVMFEISMVACATCHEKCKLLRTTHLRIVSCHGLLSMSIVKLFQLGHETLLERTRQPWTSSSRVYTAFLSNRIDRIKSIAWHYRVVVLPYPCFARLAAFGV